MSREKGQALVLFALFIVVLLGFIGLAIDVGRVYVAIGSLRRAVDAASLGAASQFREGRTIIEMTDMATQIMNMNGVSPASIVVEDCEHAVIPGDAVLCVTPRRKYVRVTASANVQMTFLRVISINQFSISANAVSEAASLDVVLVIDISESMAHYQGDHLSDTPPHHDGDQFDPSVCNPTKSCQPFEKVRTAANDFVNRILDMPTAQESDRLAIVYFSNGWQSDPVKYSFGNNNGATDVVSPGWMNDASTAHAAVNSLKVFQPPDCATNPPAGTCLQYNSGIFQGIDCPAYRLSNPNDPSSCTTTNTGGALTLAGNMFAQASRPDALWVVIFLSDGAANASNATTGHIYGYCPTTDWTSPFCRDLLADPLNLNSHHNGTSDPLHYDADDYARDSADFVGCAQTDLRELCASSHLPSGGQGALVFTIGLGNQVTKRYPGDDMPAGVALLRYIAAVGGGSDPINIPASDPCHEYNIAMDWQSNCGNYYYDATGNKLIPVFEEIASRIFTRISR
jgi:Flp pilus assembly protein TadG